MLIKLFGPEIRGGAWAAIRDRCLQWVVLQPPVRRECPTFGVCGTIEGQHGDFAEQGLDGFEQALREVLVPAAAQIGGARKSLRSNYGLDPNDFPKAHEHKGAACGARGLEIVA